MIQNDPHPNHRPTEYSLEVDYAAADVWENSFIPQ